jgi:hypothetical protein
VPLLICFVLLHRGIPAGHRLVPDLGAALAGDGIASLSFLTHFENILKGVLDLRDVCISR